MSDSPALRAMKAHLQAGTTAQLAASMLALDTSDLGQRRTKALLIDELAHRHPEVKTAVKVWADDLASDLTMDEVVIAALPKGSL